MSKRYLLGLFVVAAAACGGPAPASDSPAALGFTEDTLEERAAQAGALAAPSCTDPKKVLICHVPPGNPANAHSICVSQSAQPAHVRHGDTLGACAHGAVETPDAGQPEEPLDPMADAGTADPVHPPLPD